MQIDDYEFEEEKTLSNLAKLLEDIAEQIRDGQRLQLPMPALKEGTIELPLGEPVETGIEVALRKHFIHLTLSLAWAKPEAKGVATDE